MSFNLLASLSDTFAPHAHHPVTTLETDQKKFWYALQKEEIFDLQAIAEKYPDTFMTWESKDGPPLKTAQAWGCFESFVTLMSMGANKDTDYGGGWTPLLTAIRTGDKMLTECVAGYSPNFDAVAHDDKGRAYTALQLAIDNKDAEAVRLLIERGANAKLGIEKTDGTTVAPADYAREKRQPKIAEMLDLADQVRALYLKDRVAPVTTLTLPSPQTP